MQDKEDAQDIQSYSQGLYREYFTGKVAYCQEKSAKESAVTVRLSRCLADGGVNLAFARCPVPNELGKDAHSAKLQP